MNFILFCSFFSRIRVSFSSLSLLCVVCSFLLKGRKGRIRVLIVGLIDSIRVLA